MNPRELLGSWSVSKNNKTFLVRSKSKDPKD